MNQNIWEDNLLEKKTESDLKDLLKTFVAFSNTVKPGHIAVILIGEKDDEPIQGVTDPDNIQKKIRQEADKIFPQILWRSIIYECQKKKCIRVEIKYSANTPHFGGKAWIRKGSETIEATDDIYQKLIDIRSGKVFEIMKWIGKEVTIHGDSGSVPEPKQSGFLGRQMHYFNHRWNWEEFVKIVFVNNYWVTFEKNNQEKVSEPLNKLTLSFDDNKNQLKIIIDY